MKLIAVLLLTAVLGSCTAKNAVLNQVIDNVVANMKVNINQAGKDVIKVPDVDEDWHQKVLFITFRGHASCRDGTAKSFASVKRTGDATVTTSGNRAIVKVRLALADLEVNFPHCTLKANHLFTVSHHLNIKVNSNTIDLQLSLNGKGPQCVASLDHVILGQFNDVKIDSGRGLVHKIENNVIHGAINQFHDSIVGAVDDILADAVRKALPKLDLCSKISH
uniref:Secreted venom protein family 5 protein n=1 Tax=Pristhesancus plagipennis TaxID=1955184 RepID=A0A2K8JMF9_PRIPG|nr:secreted venom protein family 5 protein [Pristhesancus plagipennis]